MDIKLKKITIGELTEGYIDDGISGVSGYGGNLDIRPPYQREFVYKEKQRNAVINTISHGFPLNVMYWADRGEDCEGPRYEIIDGQQRTISICQYVVNDFSVKVNQDNMLFDNLQPDQQQHILDYKLMIYVCSGSASERLKWYETINIAGVTLTRQELRNAVYHGSWVSDAKRYFSRPGCAAYGIGNKYLKGSPIRQDYLETAIKWINNGNVSAYMSKHQHDKNAVTLWNYFQSVISWTKATFTTYRKEMKGVNWGDLYNQFKDGDHDPDLFEEHTSYLMMDDDVTNKQGIYTYLLTGKEKYLNIRVFTNKMKREAFERQKGICPICKKEYKFEEMEADHIKPWSKGGPTTADNCQMVSKQCNREKGAK